MILGDLDTKFVLNRSAVRIQLSLCHHAACFLLVMSKAVASPPKNIVKEIVLFRMHGHGGDFVTVIIEQLGVFPRALAVFPFDEDDALTVLIELLATLIVIVLDIASC